VLSARSRIVSVSADTAVNGAHSAVLGEDEPFQAGWDGAAAASHVDRCPVSGSPGDFDDTVTEDRVDRVWSDSGSGFDDDTGFTVGFSGMVGVDEDGQQRRRRRSSISPALPADGT
jgi:hypothetical protein